jgi:hypothetical protein
MQQGSENAKENNDQIIHQFIQGLVDERKRELYSPDNSTCS